MVLETGRQQENGIADPWGDAHAFIRRRYGGATRPSIDAWIGSASDYQLRRPVLAWLLGLGIPEMKAVAFAAALTREQLAVLTAVGLGVRTVALLAKRRKLVLSLRLEQRRQDEVLMAIATGSAAIRDARARAATR